LVATIATATVAVQPNPASAQEDCAEFGAFPTPPISAAFDRNQMLCQLGYELPSPGPRVDDPNRPPNAILPSNPETQNWTDACGHTVNRGMMGGLWVSYDDATGHGAIGFGTGDQPDIDGWAYTPIDLLETYDGVPVTTPEQWWNERRPEVFEAVKRELYGKIPDPSLWPDITWELGPVTFGTADGVDYAQRTVTGHIDISGYPQVRNAPRIAGTLRIPRDAYDAGAEVPVVIVFGGLTNWSHLAPQGWGIFAYSNNQLQPDSGGANLSSYIIGLINKGNWRSPDDWGTLAAWSWGISRLIDFFEEPTEYVGVDADRIGVQGHSRYGKAAIVAAAYEPRIKAAYASSSGALGAKMNRRHWGQNLENVGGDAEYHWMAGNFFKWMGPLVDDPENPGIGLVGNGTYKPRKLELMTVDGHSLVALAAPRVVFITGGNASDAWTARHVPRRCERYPRLQPARR
jgi:hypothetical protein